MTDEQWKESNELKFERMTDFLVFLLGILVGIVIACGAFVVRTRQHTKFCPVCGHVYTNSDTYCADDGTSLKELIN